MVNAADDHIVSKMNENYAMNFATFVTMIHTHSCHFSYLTWLLHFVLVASVCLDNALIFLKPLTSKFHFWYILVRFVYQGQCQGHRSKKSGNTSVCGWSAFD